MRHIARPLLLALGTIVLLCTPALAAAQVAASGWSRIIHAYGSHQCTPARPCPQRTGLVWDSTNAIPKYPEVLGAVGIGGEVLLTFQVGEDGAVDSNSIAVVRTNQQAFVRNSIAAVHRWRFGVEADGRPEGPITVEFHLIFARMGRCDGPRETDAGWAGWNQMVITICSILRPRSSLQRPG